MNDKPQDHARPAGKRQRRQDRRVCKLIAPPPYNAREGIVTSDRRSQIDRRANWIREFTLGGGQ